MQKGKSGEHPTLVAPLSIARALVGNQGRGAGFYFALKIDN